jgi:aminoglycoside phosphotransferase (APT) family kinase protein
VELARPRDTDALLVGFERWFRAIRRLDGAGIDGVGVDAVGRASTGYSSETILLDVRWHDRTGSRREELVLRLPPAGAGTHREFDLLAQSAAQQSAAAASIPVAEPSVAEPDPSWLGAPFMLMPRVRGHIVGESAGHDPWVRRLPRGDQAALHRGLLETLATLHRAGPARALEAGVPARDNGAELDACSAYVAWASEGTPPPALTDAVAWCRAHRPAVEPPPTLRWGDVRFGNVVFGDDLRPRALLDWDMATVGAAEHDIGWFTALEEVVETLSGRRVPGFPRPDEVPARYEPLLGRPLLDLEWYRTLALVRSAAILGRIGSLQRAAGGAPSAPVERNPVLDLLRGRLG